MAECSAAPVPVAAPVAQPVAVAQPPPIAQPIAVAQPAGQGAYGGQQYGGQPQGYEMQQVVHVGQPVSIVGQPVQSQGGQAVMVMPANQSGNAIPQPVLQAGQPGTSHDAKRMRQDSWKRGWCIGYWCGCFGFCCASDDANRVGTFMGCSWNSVCWGVLVTVIAIILFAIKPYCETHEYETRQTYGCIQLGGNFFDDQALRCVEWGDKCCHKQVFESAQGQCERARTGEECARISNEVSWQVSRICMWNAMTRQCVTDCSVFWSMTEIKIGVAIAFLVIGIIWLCIGIGTVVKAKMDSDAIDVEWLDCCC